MGLILEVSIESQNVWQFGELGRARRTTRWFAETPFIAFNFMLYLSLGVVVFGEKLEFAEYTR